jgi:hypothetical protein
MNNKTNYISFWLSQAVSELGSMMTSYALIILVYQQSRSVMQVSAHFFHICTEGGDKLFYRRICGSA